MEKTRATVCRSSCSVPYISPTDRFSLLSSVHSPAEKHRFTKKDKRDSERILFVSLVLVLILVLVLSVVLILVLVLVGLLVLIILVFVLILILVVHI